MSADVAPARPRTGYADALASSQFRVLLAAQVLVIGGTSVSSVALTVLVYRRTSSPFLASLTFALSFVPYLFAGGLLSGIVDRVRPRRLTVACDAGAAALVGVMAIPAVPLPVLFVLLFGAGMLASIAGGGFSALTRAAVSEAAYVPARSLLRIASQLAQLCGNAGGGALLLLLSSHGALLVDAGMLAAAGLMVRFSIPDHPNTGTPGEHMLIRDSLRGARSILAHPELRRLILVESLGSTFFVAPEAVAAAYVAAHHEPASTVGLWLAALPVGLIAGDLAGVRLLTPEQRSRIFAPVAAAQFLPYFAFVFDPSIPVAIPLLVLAGTSSLYLLDWDRRMRAAAPPELFARVMTLNQGVLIALQGLGFALAGAVAQATTPADAIWIAAIVGSIIMLSLLRGELRRRS